MCISRGCVAVFLSLSLVTSVCAGDYSDSFVDEAIDRLDQQARLLIAETGMPGLAIAVVNRDGVLFERGYGIRNIDTGAPVTPDTVFQLASVSKPIGAVVVASVVGDGLIEWGTPVREVFPWFSLSNPFVSDRLSIGDLYAHRSGLPDHAGDDLEQLGFTQREVFEALGKLPLEEFRVDYAYTNYGMTLAAEAVAERVGTNWAALSEERLYRPLGMTSTSSRFSDFQGRDDRAVGHVLENDAYVVGPERREQGVSRWSDAYNTDRASAAGGVSSSVRDMGRFLSFLLAGGRTADLSLSSVALAPVFTPKTIIADASDLTLRGAHYGYGFFLSMHESGQRIWNHGGAFSWGTSTAIAVLPDADVAVVILANATPNGVVDALIADFNDMVIAGAPSQDWWALYRAALAPVLAPQGRLANVSPPLQARRHMALSAYEGTYEHDFFGPLKVSSDGSGALRLSLGKNYQLVFEARHWDADTFVFSPLNDAQMPGSLSAVDFYGNKVAIEAYDRPELGAFVLSVQ